MPTPRPYFKGKRIMGVKSRGGGWFLFFFITLILGIIFKKFWISVGFIIVVGSVVSLIKKSKKPKSEDQG